MTADETQAQSKLISDAISKALDDGSVAVLVTLIDAMNDESGLAVGAKPRHSRLKHSRRNSRSFPARAFYSSASKPSRVW